MTQEEALRKAIACLKLSQSSNEHEAALAASKAQEIIDRYKLDVNSLDYDSESDKSDLETIQDYYSDPVDRMPFTRMRWISTLASTISKLNQCRIYLSPNGRGKNIHIVGRPSDVATVRYLQSYFRSEVLRLCKLNCVGYSDTYRHQFNQGVVDVICAKLVEQSSKTIQTVKTEQANNPLALIRVNKAIAKIEKRSKEVEEFIEKMNLNKGRASYSRVDTGARAHGQREGRNVRFTNARASLDSGVKSLT